MWTYISDAKARHVVCVYGVLDMTCLIRFNILRPMSLLTLFQSWREARFHLRINICTY
ncbi:hypothetical protein BDR22DRAFT_207434 [Usnea florida]